MAFLEESTVQQRSCDFVERLESGQIPKDSLRNHGKEFKGGREDLHLDSFVRFIGSTSYLMMQKRKGQHLGDRYYGI